MQNYLDLLHKIKTKGDGHNDRTGVGTISLFGEQLVFNMNDGFPILTTKKLSFRWIAEELFWFLSGSTNVEDLRNRCKNPITIWDSWATEEQCARFGRSAGELGPVYGHEWRNSGASRYGRGSGQPGIPRSRRYDDESRRYVNRGFRDDGHDQIRRLMDMLMDEQERKSRRLIVSGWNAKEADNVALPPCHTLFQFKWHEETNKLDLQLYQRSSDVFLGVPYNITSYSLLLMLVAHCCGMKPGVFTHTFGDVHIYKNHVEQVDEQLTRIPTNLPRLEIFAGSGFDGLMEASYDDLSLLDYNAQPAIPAPVAV